MTALFPVPTARGPVDVSALWQGLSGRRALIVGLTARTGLSAVRLFRKHGIPFSITDRRPVAEWESLVAGDLAPDSRLFGGPQDLGQLEGVDFILLSPGVPRSIPLIQGAYGKGIPVYHDVDFIFPFLADRKVYGITGTDGKSTVTEMLAHVLSADGGSVACGNNGFPVLEAWAGLGPVRHVVMELSSYMLEDPKHLAPDVATITNLAGDHLDRYVDMAAYGEAKKNIARHMAPGSTYVQNLDSEWTRAFRPAVGIRTTSRLEKADFRMEGGRFLFPNGVSFAAESCKVQGHHNQENILTVMAMATAGGMAPEAIIPRIQSFPGLPHRLTPVPVKRAVRVFDDSKATTLQAVHRALGSFSGPVVHLAGGRGKGLDYRELRRHEQVRVTVCYGEAGPEIARALDGRPTRVVRDFRDAVAECWGLAVDGDVILLSPACTSWDQHADYAERGRIFVETIRKLDGGRP